MKGHRLKCSFEMSHFMISVNIFFMKCM